MMKRTEKINLTHTPSPSLKKRRGVFKIPILLREVRRSELG